VIARSRGHGRITTGGITDNFERASLGANWTSVLGDPGIIASSDVGALSFSGVHIITWTGTTLTDDSFAEITVSPDLETLMQFGVFVRRRASDAARYQVHDSNDPAQARPFEWAIKYDGVATPDTKFLASNTSAPALQAGGRVRIEVRGQNPVNIRAFHNGIKVVEADDSSAERIASGPPGLAFRANVGAALTYPAKVFEDFAAGSLIAG
jgi:hypothetical protein